MDEGRVAKRRKTSAVAAPAPVVDPAERKAQKPSPGADLGAACARQCQRQQQPAACAPVRAPAKSASPPPAPAEAAADAEEDDEAFARRLQEEEKANYERDRARIRERAAEYARRREEAAAHAAAAAAAAAEEDDEDDDADATDDDDAEDGSPLDGGGVLGGDDPSSDADGDIAALRARMMEMHRFFGALRAQIRDAGGGLRDPGSRAGDLAALALVDRDFTEDDYERLLALDDANVRRGMSKSALARIPTSAWGAPPEGGIPAGTRREAGTRAEAEAAGGAPFSSAEASARCAVCLENYEAGETVRHLPCLHTYHMACVDKWLEHSVECPVCRVDLNAAMD